MCVGHACYCSSINITIWHFGWFSSVGLSCCCSKFIYLYSVPVLVYVLRVLSRTGTCARHSGTYSSTRVLHVYYTRVPVLSIFNIVSHNKGRKSSVTGCRHSSEYRRINREATPDFMNFLIDQISGQQSFFIVLFNWLRRNKMTFLSAFILAEFIILAFDWTKELTFSTFSSRLFAPSNHGS